jgi:hypothetical protein
MEHLLGQRVTIFCVNYIYVGTLVDVHDTYVALEEAEVVYETGPLASPDWKYAEALPHGWYVQRSAIESFGVLK